MAGTLKSYADGVDERPRRRVEPLRVVEDDEQRRRMLSDLSDMESMVDSTLAFVREEASTEASARVPMNS